MPLTLNLILSRLALASLLLLHVLPLEAREVVAPTDAQLWLAFYYQSPTPDQVVPQLCSLSRDGTLANAEPIGPLTAFLAAVMKANPQRIPSWLDALADLPPSEHEIVVAAAWLSRQATATAWLKEKGMKDLLKRRPPDFLDPAAGFTEPMKLDMLWGMFMASGEEAPVLRIIAALELSEHQGALKRYKLSKKTDADRAAAAADAIFEAAMWSLESNARQHPRVLATLEKAFDLKTVSKRSRLYVGLLLSKLKPRTYNATFENGIEIHVTSPAGDRVIRFTGTK